MMKMAKSTTMISPVRPYLTLLFVCVITGLPSDAHSDVSHSKPEARTVIFAVEDHPSDPMEIRDQIIDPIVLIEQEHFTELPQGGEGEGEVDPQTASFFATYYKQGQKYRLLFGGASAGTVIVKKRQNFHCSDLIATATIQTSVNLGGDVKALATNSLALGRQRNSRRPPTASEREAFLKVARDAYKRNGISAALLAQMQTMNLTATDVDGDGSAELIGNFRIGDIRDDDKKVHALFLIAEIQDGRYRPGLVLYHAGKGESFGEYKLVDQLDLDGDGVAEVITKVVGYEGYGYHIYKRQKDQWKEIYKGGGGGC